jgi:hypothetical protein
LHFRAILNSKIQAGLPMDYGKGWGKRSLNPAENQAGKFFYFVPKWNKAASAI